MARPSDLAGDASWEAELVLGVVARQGRSVLATRRHVGPLAVQRPLYPEGDQVCHVIMLHPPGGVAGGDRLVTHVDVGSGAHALLTTPGATKVYRAVQRPSVQNHALHVASGAALEWLPQETIVFDGAYLQTTSVVHLRGDARYLGWEMVVLGRRARQERFRTGQVSLSSTLVRDGVPVVWDHLRGAATDAVFEESWGLAGAGATGTLLASPAAAHDVTAVRACLDGSNDAASRAGVTLLDGVLMLRALADTSGRVRSCLERAWAVLRRPIVGREALRPRIWNT